MAGAQVAAPDQLARTAYTASPRTISLSWKDNSNNETQFTIEKSGNGGTSWEAFGQVSSGGTTFSGTLPAGFFCFRVQATDGTVVSNPSNIISVEGTDPAIADTDGDGMKDAAEAAQGLDPYYDDSLEDKDGDRYPNIFEYARGSSPADSASVPVADYIADPEASPSGNVYRTIQGALDQVTSDHRVVLVREGIYSGSGNVNLDLSGSHAVLLIGENGARTTILDGGSAARLLNVPAGGVVDGLTFRNGSASEGGAINVTGGTLLVVNCVFTGNSAAQSGGAVYQAGGYTQLLHSTFLGNTAAEEGSSLYGEDGQVTAAKSILWNSGTASEIGMSGTGASVEVTESIVRGGFGGAGNQDANPLVRLDGHLAAGSPAIDGGGKLRTSLLDMDGEVRPAGSTTDMGADEWTDTDSDNLPDWWELDRLGSLNSTGTGDPDGDGMTNQQEYEAGSDPLNSYSPGETTGNGNGQGGRVIYVNGAIGDDSKSGGQPIWTALDAPKKTVNGAIEEAEAGDRIVLKGGVYPESMSFAFPGEGRVIIEATEKVILGTPTEQTTNQPTNE